MKRLLGWYGAGPLHLLSLLACFALAGYAAVQFVASRPLAVAVWFVGAVIGHDLLLVPLYSLADRSARAVIRHRAPGLPAVAWINYVRVPAALSGLLLLVWFPLIFRLTAVYHASTTLSPDPYLWHWLAVTGALFLLSAVVFAVRLRGTRVPAPPPEGEGEARPADGEGVLPEGTAADTGPADGDRRRDEEGLIAGSAEPAAQQAADGPTPEESVTGPRPRETHAGPGSRETCAGPGSRETHAGPGSREACAGPGPQAIARDPGAAGPPRDQPGRSAAAGDGDPD
jgi:hypothetical protein